MRTSHAKVRDEGMCKRSAATENNCGECGNPTADTGHVGVQVSDWLARYLQFPICDDVLKRIGVSGETAAWNCRNTRTQLPRFLAYLKPQYSQLILMLVQLHRHATSAEAKMGECKTK